MLVVRADDGESYESNLTLLDVEQTRSSLKAYLSELTGFDASAILCFLSDGTQLRNENLRELAGVEDQTIYVFNREYLDLPVDQILADLIVEPQLQPEVDGAYQLNGLHLSCQFEKAPTDRHDMSPSSAHAHQSSPPLLLSAYSRAANFHYQHLVHRAASMTAQCAALGVASRNLDSHVLSLTSAYDVFATSAQKDLERQDEVLRGHATDMEIIGRIKVHRDFLSPNVRRAVDMGGQERRLGDYVNAHKMQQVADTSVRLHEELVQRFNNAQAQIHELTSGADDVRAGTANPLAVEVDGLLHRAKDISDRITDASLDVPIEEIQELDALLRDEVRIMADYKNQLTNHCVHVVRQVSKLQSILADLPSELAALEADLRAKAGFPHLQRLHNMLYFYGATIVEIVRRKEFAKLFTERAQTIAEMMAKLTANERKRRQVYRSEVHKQLPFEPRGMDDPAPALEINTTGNEEPPFSITRDDLIDFLALVDEISETVAVPEADNPQAESQSAFIHPAREVRVALDKLISRIDTLESDFDKLAEKSNSNEVSASAYRDAIEQLRGKAEQERQMLEDRGGLESEIRRLTSELHAARGERDAANSQAHSLSGKIESLEDDLQVLRDQVSSESAARRSLEQRHSDSLAEALSQAKLLEGALSEATERTRDAEKLKCELSSAKDEAARIRELHEASDRRIAALLEEQADTLRRIEEARAHGEDLEAQLRTAVDEGQQAFAALKQAAAENERILRDHASEADRVLKDQVAEADGDRAVLEHQLAEARNQLDQRSKDISELKKYILGPKHASANAVAAGSTSTGADDFGAASLIMSTTSNMLATSQFPSSSSFPPSTSSAIHAAFPAQSIAASGAGQSPTGPLTPQEALAGLAAFDLDAFTETMNKTGSTIRKWQKQCKEYRERARGKIAYRNFQKGDLALFLPTRNSETRPWAAFNGHLRDQLQHREWVVARITSITERVVDRAIPDSNPYKLGDGVKYFMLEVEDWTQPAPQATSPRSPEPSRPGQQRSNSLSGSILPARSSPSNGTKPRLVGRSASDGGTLQGRPNGVDRTVGAGKSGPGEARTDPAAGVPTIAEKDTDTDDPKEGSSSKGLPVSSVGNRTSATTKNASPSPPPSPPTIRASTSLLSTSLRQPLPRPPNDSDEEDDHSRPLRHSMHAMARAVSTITGSNNTGSEGPFSKKGNSKYRRSWSNKYKPSAKHPHNANCGSIQSVRGRRDVSKIGQGQGQGTASIDH
ncbi:oligomeric, coiled-coil, peripheral membrane protein [Tulasnella sp. 417]|nr:oligomeric, coiled-coil, peripheral membrane protein [Tulasnella sp. 417]